MKTYWFGRRVLVTGGLGFIGSNIVERLAEEGAIVTVLDNLSPFAGGNLSNGDSFRERIQLSHDSVEEASVAGRVIMGQDDVIHCASLSSHPGSMKDPKSNIEVNCAGTIQILEAIKRYNPKCRFAQLGTTTQLGRLQYQPADENHPEFPLDIYSANKCAAEMYTLIYAQAFGLQTTIVRLPNVFGPRAAIHSPEFTFNNYFIGLALAKRPITVYGKGEQKRNSLYVDDAVEAVLCVLSQFKKSGDVFLATSDEHHSVREIAEEIVTAAGSSRVEEVPWPPQRLSLEVGDAVFTNAKIKETFNWQPRWSMRDGLERTMAFYHPRLDIYLR